MDSVLLKKMKSAARSYLKKNFELDKWHRMATFLHPQFKSLKFAEEYFKLITVRDIKELVATVTVSTETNTLRRKISSSNSIFSDFLDDEHDLDEVELYTAYKVNATTNVDVLNWWSDHRESFPKLYSVATFVHAITATSAPSERRFSLAGKVLNCLRTSLDPSKVSDLLLLYSNSEQFDSETIN